MEYDDSDNEIGDDPSVKDLLVDILEELQTQTRLLTAIEIRMTSGLFPMDRDGYVLVTPRGQEPSTPVWAGGDKK